MRAVCVYVPCVCNGGGGVEGRPPFEARNHLSLAVKINAGKFPPIPSTYSEDLHRTIRWMLNVDVRAGQCRFAPRGSQLSSSQRTATGARGGVCARGAWPAVAPCAFPVLHSLLY
jgi:hypothetical protein